MFNRQGAKVAKEDKQPNQFAVSEATMAAGGPGDHPILDIINYQIDFYGMEASGLIREMAKLMSQRELHEWWQSKLNYDSPQQHVVLEAKIKLKWAVDRAKKSGWELPG